MKAAIRWIVLISFTAVMAGVVQAKGPKTADDGSARYIVVLEQAPLAEWHVQRPDSTSALENGVSAKRAGKGVRNRLDAGAPESGRTWMNWKEVTKRSAPGPKPAWGAR